MKELTNREIASIKRICQNVDADYQKVCKLNAKIDELTAERDELQLGIDEMEAPVMRKTGGYKSTDLVEKVVTPCFNPDGTPRLDKDGRQVKSTKFVQKYPNFLPEENGGVSNESVAEPTTEPTQEVVEPSPETPVSEEGNVPTPGGFPFS